MNGRPLWFTRDHWRSALQNQRQRFLRIDVLNQDAVLEGDGAVHAPGEVRIVGGDQGGVGSGAVVTTHPGGVLVPMTYCLCFT